MVLILRLSVVFLILWVAPSALAETGQVAVWQHERAVAIETPLPAFDSGGVLSTPLVRMTGVPAGTVPDASGCLCFALDDERFAYVHTFYYAHLALETYNHVLAELGIAPLTGVMIKLTRDPSMPTSGSANDREGPRIELNYPAPALDVYTLAHEVGHLIDYHISPRHDVVRADAELPDDREMAEEAGVGEGTANLLAALHLGQTSSRVFTDEYLDVPPSTDVNQFVRFPDLEITRRDVMNDLVQAPRFGARYPEFVAQVTSTLADPALASYLAQPDEYASSAIVNQPLWQAAMKHGVPLVQRIYLKTLAQWSSPDVNYAALARQLVATAAAESPGLAAELRSAYAARGLSL